MKFFDSLFGRNQQVLVRAEPDFQIVDQSTQMIDSWQDTDKRIGLARSKATFAYTQLDYESLSYLTDFDWLSRRIVRSLPEAAWQNELIFADPDVKKEWNRVNYVEGNDDGAFLTAAIWARTHGAALLIMGHAFSGDVENPLPEKHGPVEFLSPVSVLDYEVHPQDLNTDKNDPIHFGLPEYYRISGDHRFKGLRFHRSRVIHFSGPVPSGIYSSRDPDKLVGLSVLDPVYERVQGYGLTWAAVQSMTEQASIPIWTLKGLISGLTRNPKEIKERMELQQDMISTNRAVMLDADSNEAYRREAANFSDVPQILQQYSLQVAAAGEIPAQELFGRLISGLGDTGEGESKKWESKIDNYRTRTLAPRIRQILGDDVEWEFAPISTPPPKDWAATVKEWWTMGMITDLELRKLTEEALTLPELEEKDLGELLSLGQRTRELPEEGEREESESEDEEAQAAE